MKLANFYQMNGFCRGLSLALILSVMALAVSTTNAQDWQDISPGTTSERFMGVSFVDENTGWACGWDYENLYHTADGGQTWNLQDPVVQYVMFEDIDFCDANNGMATGNEGAVLYTKDGGQTWEAAEYGWWLTYNCCHMLNPDVGISGGSNTINQPLVTGTVDGWASLVQMIFYIKIGGVSNEGKIYGISMIDENVGYAACRAWTGEGAICRTMDGSATPWETVIDFPYACYGIDFPTSQVGYVCCDDGNILKSTDGGATWNTLSTGVSDRLYDIHFADENTGVAVGMAGLIISTTDGGATWTQENSGVSVTLNDVTCVSADVAYAAGDSGTIIGKLNVGPLALKASPGEISVRTGGTIDFTLEAGPDYSNREYVLLGTISGTDPGTLLPGGTTTLPLNWDGFTSIVLTLLNTPNFANFIGILDADGMAAAQASSGPLHPGCIGVTMHYAYCLMGPFDFASNAVAVEVLE